MTESISNMSSCDAGGCLVTFIRGPPDQLNSRYCLPSGSVPFSHPLTPNVSDFLILQQRRPFRFEGFKGRTKENGWRTGHVTNGQGWERWGVREGQMRGRERHFLKMSALGRREIVWVEGRGVGWALGGRGWTG